MDNFMLAGERSSEPATHTGRLNIGRLADLTGLSVETIRYYERIGLLERASRTDSGYRIFSAEAVQRINFIRKAQRLGFSLTEIRELIDHKRSGENPCREVRMLVRRKIAEIEEKIAEMTEFRRVLESALNEWEGIGDRPGHVCGLIENYDPAERPNRDTFHNGAAPEKDFS